MHPVGYLYEDYHDARSLEHKVPFNLHETYQLPRVQLITPDDGHSRCPKHVQFRDKIKFWVLDASCWLLIRRCKKKKFRVTFLGVCVVFPYTESHNPLH
jgi:hypothetical protein